MKIPVYITTYASKLIGTVDANSAEEFETAAEKLWEKNGYDSPSLCHQCSNDVELGDWDVNTSHLRSYLKEKS